MTVDSSLVLNAVIIVTYKGAAITRQPKIKNKYLKKLEGRSCFSFFAFMVSPPSSSS